MWKESLRIGVDLIDQQHKQLFDRTDELLKNLRDGVTAHKQECIDTILFLKQYAVKHFADEEAYQKSIGYQGFDAHKKLHETFVKTVLEHEKAMKASDFAEKDIKSFVGMLTTWLLFHVADIDQQYAQHPGQQLGIHKDIALYQHVTHVLDAVVGLNPAAMKQVETHNETFGDAIAIEVAFSGGISGYLTLLYPCAAVKEMINAMMGFIPEDIDELSMSSLLEISAIISDAVCGQFAKNKGATCDVSKPFMTKRSELHPDERIAIDTGVGIIEVDISIDL